MIINFKKLIRKIVQENKIQKQFKLQNQRMTQIGSLQSNNNQIESLLKANSSDHDKIKGLIKKNKIIVFSVDDISKEQEAFLIQARRFAQLNLLASLTNNNSKDFQIAVDNVKFFYENTLNATPSPQYHLVTGIHLLFLLSSHRTEEFYAKIQTLNSNDLRDKYISFVLLINDAIEQGNYRRVFQLKKESPLNYFNPFLNRISETVRIQIAKSAEKAYAQLSVFEAMKIFQLQNEAQLKQFIERYCEGVEQQSVKWVFNGGKIFFQKANTKKIVFNSNQLILTTLNYAHELQKIA